MPGPESLPSSETRKAERDDAQTEAHSDREPTPEESEAAEQQPLGEDVPEHYEEMAERGAHQAGEGRIP